MVHVPVEDSHSLEPQVLCGNACGQSHVTLDAANFRGLEAVQRDMCQLRCVPYVCAQRATPGAHPIGLCLLCPPS